MALAEVLVRPRLEPPERGDLRLLAVLLLAVWGLNMPIAAGLTSTAVAGLVSAPLWVPGLGQYRYGRPAMIIGGIMIIGGLLLGLYQSSGRTYDVGLGIAQVLLLVGALTGVGLILWARRLLSVGAVAAVLGGAMVLGNLSAVGAANPWKAGLAMPLTIMALGVASKAKTWVQIAVLLGLSAVNIVFDTRSLAGLCLLGVLFLGLQMFKVRPPAGWAGLLVVATLGAVATYGLYSVGASLAANGTLGQAIADRTQTQLMDAGSLIAGARPEWVGTIGLMTEHPIGYGFGAVPAYADVWAARQGLYTVGIGSNSGYVDNYMFGGEFKLHSTTADLWSQAGFLGLAFALFVATALVGSLADRLRTATLTGLCALLAAKAMWDLGFSPVYTSAIGIAIALGFVLTLKDQVAEEPASPEPPSGIPAAFRSRDLEPWAQRLQRGDLLLDRQPLVPAAAGSAPRSP